jgi:hypothetical protein
MGSYRPTTRVFVLFHKLASLKFTVIVMLFIALLVIAGTIFRVQLGIHAAQQIVTVFY